MDNEILTGDQSNGSEIRTDQPGGSNIPIRPGDVLQNGVVTHGDQGDGLRAGQPSSAAGGPGLAMDLQPPPWALKLQQDIQDMRTITQQSMMSVQSSVAGLKRKEPDLEWNRKGNKLQYQANQKVLDELEEGMSALNRGDGAQLRASLTSGIDKLKYRQKEIRMADHYQDWTVVEKYNAHPLADNPEDDKKIRKAQKDAEKEKAKKVEKKPKKTPQKFSPYKQQFHRQEQAGFRFVGSARSQSQYQQSVPIPILQGRQRIQQPGCFTCGGNHLARNCPESLKSGKQCEFCDNFDFHFVDCTSMLTINTCKCHAFCTNFSGCRITGSDIAPIDSKYYNTSLDDEHEVCNEFDFASTYKEKADSSQQQDAILQGNKFLYMSACKTSYDLNNNKYLCSEYVSKVYSDDYDSYEKGETEISVVGRLQRLGVPFLLKHNANKIIIDILKNGYIIPFILFPAPAIFRNNLSARRKIKFVWLEVSKLLDTGSVSECIEIPYIVNPLTVATKDDKDRLVLDCRYLNKFIIKISVKFEGADILLQYIHKNGYMIDLDMKSGYHHVNVHPGCRPLLGFSVTDEWGRKRYFYFNCLPFGLTSAGLVFTKVLREWVKIWRAQGILILFFLDDGNIVGSSVYETFKHGQVVKTDLVSSGWVPNREKSCWYPRQVVEWLGFIYNLIKGMILASEVKIERVKEALRLLLSKSHAPVKELASAAGKVQALQLAMGDIVFLKTRAMQMQIACTEDWFQVIELSENSLAECEFWLYNIEQFNGYCFLEKSAAAKVIYSDASKHGYAAFTAPAPDARELVVHREWVDDEAQTSSTFRELTAVYEGLRDLAPMCTDTIVDWFTDSMNVTIIVKRGSMDEKLQLLALRIFMVCRKFNIKLRVIWIPRDKNEKADMYSRIVDFDDWAVRPDWFDIIVKRFGLPTVDRFASVTNRKVKRYNSRFFEPLAEAVDAFSQNWHGELNYAAPPIYLIARVLKHVCECKAVAILVVPCWKSAAFWPILLAEMYAARSIVIDKLELGNIVQNGPEYNSTFARHQWHSGFWVLLLDGSISAV